MVFLQVQSIEILVLTANRAIIIHCAFFVKISSCPSPFDNQTLKLHNPVYYLILKWSSMNRPYLLVLYYSRTGATAQLAQYIARGIATTEHFEARIRTVPPVSTTIEAIDEPIPDTGAPYISLDDLRECSGLALGSPTRFGNMAAAMKYFWDTTSGLWLSGALIDKPASVFSSSSSMHGGQESTLLSMMLPLLHHGMIIAGIPFSEAALSQTQTGGTPYGVTHVSGSNNDKALSDDEITLAKAQGLRLARIAHALKEGA